MRCSIGCAGHRNVAALDVNLTVVTYNSARVLPALLASLLRQTFDRKRLALSFVDNGSSDDTVAILERWRDEHASAFGAFHSSRGANDGFGAGQNRAAAAGSSPFLFVLNPDTELPPECIARLYAVAVADDARVAAWEARQLPYGIPRSTTRSRSTCRGSRARACCSVVRRSTRWAVSIPPTSCIARTSICRGVCAPRAGACGTYRPPPSGTTAMQRPARSSRRSCASSVIGNLYLRARFGTSRDVAQGVMSYVDLVTGPPPIAGMRTKLVAPWPRSCATGRTSSTAVAAPPSASTAGTTRRAAPATSTNRCRATTSHGDPRSRSWCGPSGACRCCAAR